jgi:putative transposase
LSLTTGIDEHYVWAAVDCETLKVLAVKISPGRSSLNALLFLNDVLERGYGRPLVRADRSPWYDWPIELLDCEYERETWRNRSLIEAWFGSSNTELDVSIVNFLSIASSA